MFQAVYWMAKYYGARNVKDWNSLKDKTRIRFCVKASSMVHCLIVLPVCTYLIFVDTPRSLEVDHIYGRSKASDLVFEISTAYFFWDFIAVLVYKTIPWDYFIHHSACFLVYVIVQQPFFHYHALRPLLFEYSTIFFNLRFWMMTLKIDSVYIRLFTATQIGFIATFFATRIIMGVPISYYVFKDLWEVYSSGRLNHPISAIYLSICNIGVLVLNLVWGRKIVRMGTRLLFPRKESKQQKQE